VIWIFDANDPCDGASRSVIEHEEGIIRVISHLRDRVVKASRIARQVKDRADHTDPRDYREPPDSKDEPDSGSER
jgi:hypothetical protein